MLDQSLPELPAETADAFDLGLVLGESKAFGLTRGQSAAARAERLHRIRERQLYKCVTPKWETFCTQYLKISRAEADWDIRLWQEFGAGYFELAGLTRISPETYRAIAPAVKDGALHLDGEAIQLTAGNVQKIAAAVAWLRRARFQKQPRQLEPHQRIDELDQRCAALLLEFDHIACKERHGENWLAFTRVLDRTHAALTRMAQQHGLIEK